MGNASSGNDGRAHTDMVHAAMRGAVAAMSMSGMRVLSNALGLIEKTPPEMVTDQRISRAVRGMSDDSRDAFIVALHWAYGAAGGAVFGALPQRIRQAPGAGPVFGLVLWVAFEAVLTPALGLSFSRRGTTSERLALALDHVLYGVVLAEMRRAPRR